MRGGGGDSLDVAHPAHATLVTVCTPSHLAPRRRASMPWRPCRHGPLNGPVGGASRGMLAALLTRPRPALPLRGAGRPLPWPCHAPTAAASPPLGSWVPAGKDGHSREAATAARQPRRRGGPAHPHTPAPRPGPLGSSRPPLRRPPSAGPRACGVMAVGRCQAGSACRCPPRSGWLPLWAPPSPVAAWVAK